MLARKLRRTTSSRAVSLIVTALIAAALYPGVASATSWSASAGGEADDNGASSVDADMSWSPTERFGLSFSAGHSSGTDDIDQSFSASTLLAGIDWQITKHFGVALGYDAWDDPDTYEKRTVHATAWMGGEHVRFALLGQSVSSETTAELALLRRTASINFDGNGYGAELTLSGERASVYGSYMSYDYEDSVDRLLTFLASPALARRPRLEALLGSSVTTAAALLDYSATIGADLFVGRARLGFSYSPFKDIVTNDDSRVFRGEVEWPLTAHWSGQVIAGVSDSDFSGSVPFGGARIVYRSR